MGEIANWMAQELKQEKLDALEAAIEHLLHELPYTAERLQEIYEDLQKEG